MSIVSEDRMSSPVAARPGLRRTVAVFGLAAALLWSPGASADSGKKWKAQGPGPNTEGQVEGIADGEVSGAVQVVVTHPTDSKKMWIGAVNGGVWETDNATSNNIKWKRLTDEQQSNSIGALDLDPTDNKNKTLVAGIGRFSSFGSTGGARIGLLRTTDGGKNWTVRNGGGVLNDKNISGVAARGNVLVVSVNTALAFTFANIGIWRSADGGATFTQIAVGNGAATGLPGGVTNDLVGVRGNPNRLFTGVVFADSVGGQNGVYRSDNAGATWTKVSSPQMDALIISGVTNNLEFATGRHNNVYAAIVNSGRLAAIFRSGDGGGTWVRMDLPLVPRATRPASTPAARAPSTCRSWPTRATPTSSMSAATASPGPTSRSRRSRSPMRLGPRTSPAVSSAATLRCRPAASGPTSPTRRPPCYRTAARPRTPRRTPTRARWPSTPPAT